MQLSKAKHWKDKLDMILTSGVDQTIPHLCCYLQQFFQVNCSRSGSATQAAVLVLYLLCSLGVMLTSQSFVPLECGIIFEADVKVM